MVVVVIVAIVAVRFFMVVVGVILLVACAYDLDLSLGTFSTLVFVTEAAAIVVSMFGAVVSYVLSCFTCLLMWSCLSLLR